MKQLILFFLIITLNSCLSLKKNLSTNVGNSNLTELERVIINDFLDNELRKDKFKKYENNDIIIIEEALKKTKPLSDYEFNFKYKDSWGKFINEWLLDSIQINKIRSEIEKEEVYHWNELDFKNKKMSLLKYSLFRQKIEAKKQLFEKDAFVIFLSKPLIVNDENAFLSYNFLNCNYLCLGINHSTVLMKKVNNKWIVDSYFEDGIYE